jgi:hypothetical protein
VLVTLGQNATEVRWTSTLEPAETVSLQAPTEGRVSEIWVLACSALWHCESEGLSPTESASGASWEPRFHPWPGESLVLTMSRPAAAEGQSITIDRATLTVRPGVRLSSSTLELGVRTSVSAPLRLTVPSATRRALPERRRRHPPPSARRGSSGDRPSARLAHHPPRVAGGTRLGSGVRDAEHHHRSHGGERRAHRGRAAPIAGSSGSLARAGARPCSSGRIWR